MHSQPTVIGDDGFISEHHIVLDRGVAADVAVAPEDRSANDCFLADSRVGPDDRLVHYRVLLDVALTADYAVGRDVRAGFDDRAFVDEAGPLDDRAVLHFGLRRYPGGAGAVAERRRVIPPIHDVAMHLLIFVGRADVNPVAAIDVGDEGLVTVDQ